jgi:hypothetical protein
VLVGPTVSTHRRKHNKRVVFRDGRGRSDPRSQDGAIDDAFDLVRPSNSTRTLGLNESKFAFPRIDQQAKLLKSCWNIELPTEPRRTEGSKNG